MNSRTDIIKECNGEPLIGPSTGSVSVTAYVDGMHIYKGCQASAQVSIPWVRRYDCESDTVYYINAGKGTASIIGETYVSPYARILNDTGRRYSNISANVGQGPATIYAVQEQIDGYGLDYHGGPINFNSGNENDITFSFGSIVPSDFDKPSGATDLYLQSFNLNLNPGEVPQVSYSFAFGITDR
jgi:hypothetical protein